MTDVPHTSTNTHQVTAARGAAPLCHYADSGSKRHAATLSAAQFSSSPWLCQRDEDDDDPPPFRQGPTMGWATRSTHVSPSGGTGSALPASYVCKQHTDMRAPALRAQRGMDQTDTHGLVDVKTDITGLHTPVRLPPASLCGRVGDNCVVPGGIRRHDVRITGTALKRSNFPSSSGGGERGFLLPILSHSKKVRRVSPHPRPVPVQPVRHGTSIPHVDYQTCVGMCATKSGLRPWI